MAEQRFVTYYRVSTDRQGRSGLGLDAQRDAVSQFLSARPATVIAEYVEVESGGRDDRPKLRDALDTCQRGKAILLIAKLDRLARSVAFVAGLMDGNTEFVAVDNWIAGSIGRGGFSLVYTVRKNDAQVELWIGLGAGQTAKNKAAFKMLEAQKAAIEADFGGPLDWQELPDGEGCRVRGLIDGGYRSPQEQWPAIQAKLADAMVKLDAAMRARVASLAL